MRELTCVCHRRGFPRCDESSIEYLFLKWALYRKARESLCSISTIPPMGNRINRTAVEKKAIWCKNCEICTELYVLSGIFVMRSDLP